MKLILFLLLINVAMAQQTIKDLTVGDLTAKDFKVTGTVKGSNPCPVMDEVQRDAIVALTDGQCIYNTTTSKLNIYNGVLWKAAGGGVDAWQVGSTYAIDDLVIESNKIYKALNAHVSTDFALELANGDWVEISEVGIIDLDTGVTGTLAIVNGGTGEVTKSFVDLTTDQTIEGHKNFENSITSDNSNNGNLLVNPSFEYTLPTQGWTCAADTIVALSSDDFLTDGKKFLSITTEGIGEGCEQEVLIHTANIGKVYSVTIDAMASSVDYEVCRKEGAVEIECKNIENDIKPEKIGFIFNANVKSNTFIARAKTVALGFMRLDNANFSIPNDNGLLLNIKNSSKWEPCTFSTLAWQGFGTVNPSILCLRDGTSLRMKGSLVVGTVAAVEARMPLPTNYGLIKTLFIPSSNSLPQLAGTYTRHVTIANKGGNVIIPVLSSDFLNFSSADYISPTLINGMLPFNGTGVTAVGQTISIDVYVPIAEWQQNLNVAVSKCLEGPLKCTNTYAIHVSSTGVIKSQPEGWVSSVSSGRIDFTSGIFTTPPICVVSPDNQSNNTTGSRINLTSSKDFLSWASYTSSTGVITGAFIHCTKTGSDNTNHDNIFVLPSRYIVKTGVIGTSWWEVNNDGWVRQGGRTDGAGAGTLVTFTFPILMKDANYTPICTNHGGRSMPNNGAYDGCTNLTTASAGGLGYSTYKDVIVEGYGDSATVRSLGAFPNY